MRTFSTIIAKHDAEITYATRNGFPFRARVETARLAVTRAHMASVGKTAARTVTNPDKYALADAWIASDEACGAIVEAS